MHLRGGSWEKRTIAVLGERRKRRWAGNSLKAHYGLDLWIEQDNDSKQTSIAIKSVRDQQHKLLLYVCAPEDILKFPERV